MQIPEPQWEHAWLQRLVGEWTSETECTMGPDQPPMKTSGRETVRALGGLWTLGEGEAGTPDGGSFKSVMTLGYDPVQQRFVGSFVASVMTWHWIYKGSLDADKKVLTLDTEGPSFTDDGTLAKFQDIIEFLSDDHRTLASQYQTPDGNWVHFMKAHYRRVT